MRVDAPHVPAEEFSTNDVFVRVASMDVPLHTGAVCHWADAASHTQTSAAALRLCFRRV